MPVRARIPAQPVTSDEQRTCARADWCTGYRIVPASDGTSKRAPGLTWQVFCDADTNLIAGHLDPGRGLPAAWLRLAADIGDPARRGQVIHVPFGPRMLLSEYYDMLMRRIAEVLCSYEERVRDVARLVPLDTQASALRDPYRAVTQAARTLSAHLSALLALPPGPMMRHVPAGEISYRVLERTASPVLAIWQDATRVGSRSRDGTAMIMPVLSGAGAGLEILDLHRRCLAALGEVATHPEILDGIPCRCCGVMGLERAEPPSDPKTEADFSQCPSFSCADRMKLETYRAWVKRYEAWVKGIGPLTCRRCEIAAEKKTDHGQCIYPGCECARYGHQRAALTPLAAA